MSVRLSARVRFSRSATENFVISPFFTVSCLPHKDDAEDRAPQSADQSHIDIIQHTKRYPSNLTIHCLGRR